MNTPGWAWVAGRLMPLDKASVPLVDPGFLLGDGVFESLRARRGRIFEWPRHRARMEHGLAVLGIEPEVLDGVEDALEALADAAAPAFDEQYLRLQVVREAGPADPAGGWVTALVRPLPEYPAHWHERGVRLGAAEWKTDPDSPLAGVKSLSYLSQVLARRRAQARGFDDALVLNTEERVCESAHGNVIARLGRTLYAPGREEGALAGVTRDLLLEWAEVNGYEVEIRLPWDVLDGMEEVVLVSTLAGVVPVTGVEGLNVRFAGAGGELAAAMTQAYEDMLGR